MHGFLSDVPVYDVWLLRLPGGGSGRTVSDVMEVFLARGRLSGEHGGSRFVCRASRSRSPLRMGWSRPGKELLRIVHRSLIPSRRVTLTRQTRYSPLVWKGSSIDSNGKRSSRSSTPRCTPSCSSLSSRRRTVIGSTGPSTLRPVSWLTPIYMAAIDPFRRIVIYPAVIRRIEDAWRVKWAPSLERSSCV